MLWTNPNPLSSFSTQSVTTEDDSDYKYILLVYDAYVPYNDYHTALFVKPEQQSTLPFNEVLYINGVIVRERYWQRLSATESRFTDGKENGVVHNDKCVPLQLIGIKSI